MYQKLHLHLLHSHSVMPALPQAQEFFQKIVHVHSHLNFHLKLRGFIVSFVSSKICTQNGV